MPNNVCTEFQRCWRFPALDSDQEHIQMGIEAILGVVVFVALFGLWVILPSKLRKNRD